MLDADGVNTGTPTLSMLTYADSIYSSFGYLSRPLFIRVLFFCLINRWNNIYIYNDHKRQAARVYISHLRDRIVQDQGMDYFISLIEYSMVRVI